MMSRCTSLVPPPKVKMSAARCARSIRPASTSPGEPDRTAADAPSTSISSRYASTANSVPNTFVADASAGPTTPAEATRQFISFRNSALACTRARLSLTHSASITRPRWPAGSTRPVPHVGQRRHHRRRRGQRDPLVVELVGDQRPAPVLLADQGRAGTRTEE